MPENGWSGAELERFAPLRSTPLRFPAWKEASRGADLAGEISDESTSAPAPIALGLAIAARCPDLAWRRSRRQQAGEAATPSGSHQLS